MSIECGTGIFCCVGFGWFTNEFDFRAWAGHGGGSWRQQHFSIASNHAEIFVSICSLDSGGEQSSGGQIGRRNPSHQRGVCQILQSQPNPAPETNGASLGALPEIGLFLAPNPMTSRRLPPPAPPARNVVPEIGYANQIH